MRYIDYLPNISSLEGMIFYSLITYVFIFSFSYCCTWLIEDKIDYDKRIDKIIKKNRIKKT